MAKTVIVMSAAVTAFLLALTAAAMYAYRTLSTASAAAQQPASQQSSAPVNAPVQLSADPTQAQPTTVPNVSPQDAASLAAKYLNRTDLYSVQLADLKGTQTYMVTFSRGDVVYVGLQGQVLASLPAPTPAPPVVTTYSGGGGGGGGGGGHHGGEGEDGGGD